MAKHTRSSALSDDVTWDDVRLAKSNGRRAHVAICSILVVFFLVAGFVWREVPMKMTTTSKISRVSIQPRRTTRLSLCDTLKNWSASSVLRLGSATRRACGE